MVALNGRKDKFCLEIARQVIAYLKFPDTIVSIFKPPISRHRFEVSVVCFRMTHFD